jgi:glycerol kinase
VEREMTAIGAAALAGLGVGIWRDAGELSAAWRCGARYQPGADREQADALHRGWLDAVQRTVLSS